MFIVANEGGQDVGETSGDRGRRGGGRGELRRMIYQWTHTTQYPPQFQIDVAAMLKPSFQFLLFHMYVTKEEQRR